MHSPRVMQTRGAAFAPALVLAVLGGLMMMSADNFMSAFVPPVTGARPRASFQMPEEVLAPVSPVPTAPIFTAVALAGCLAASLRLVKRHSGRACRAHLVQLKAASSEEKEKDKDEEVDEDDDDEEEEEEEEEDDLDEIVMEDDDEDDEDDYEDEDDDDFEADDDDIVYGEDELDDSFFTTDEGGEVVEAKCRARFLKGSPWKFRRVLWQIRGRSYREALMLLEFMPWRACRPTLVCLQSAAANAQNHFNMDKSRLYVYRCQAERGPYSKRMRPMSKGQPHAYRRRSTHLEIIVREMSDEEMMKRKEFA